MNLLLQSATFFNFRALPFAPLAALKEAEPVRAVKAALHAADTISIETGGTAKTRFNSSHVSRDSQPLRPKGFRKARYNGQDSGGTAEISNSLICRQPSRPNNPQQLGRVASFMYESSRSYHLTKRVLMLRNFALKIKIKLSGGGS